jgi:hypothetical protein
MAHRNQSLPNGNDDDVKQSGTAEGRVEEVAKEIVNELEAVAERGLKGKESVRNFHVAIRFVSF